MATHWWTTAICINSIKLADLTLLSAAGHIKSWPCLMLPLAKTDGVSTTNREHKGTNKQAKKKSYQALFLFLILPKLDHNGPP